MSMHKRGQYGAVNKIAETGGPYRTFAMEVHP